MGTFKTEQEDFWAGTFGDEYIKRNSNKKILSGNLCFFSQILKSTRNIETVIEFGANIGLNLVAIKELIPDIEVSAVEINEMAVCELRKQFLHNKIYHQSILNFVPDYKRDFVLIKGVLIHMRPDVLPFVYDILYKTTKKYICIAEYYNPTPIALDYRGHKNKLFKRDFAGEMLDTYKDLYLVDYGFTYHRDNYNLYDDVNWFLLEKHF